MSVNIRFFPGLLGYRVPETVRIEQLGIFHALVNENNKKYKTFIENYR